MAVFEWIKSLRMDCNETQQVFSTRLGLSLRSYIKYEQGQIPEPRALLRFMALALETGKKFQYLRLKQTLLNQLDMPPGWTIEIELKKERQTGAKK
jgi:transcriptional regulator with XRE-family HTH domain